MLAILEFDYDAQLPPCPACGWVPPPPPYPQGRNAMHVCSKRPELKCRLVFEGIIEEWPDFVKNASKAMESKARP